MTTPSPLAEFLPAPLGALPASPGGDAGDPGGPRFVIDASGLPRAADFAALLQNAGIDVPPLVPEERPAAARDASPDAAAAPTAPPSAIDGLLFLAVVQTPPHATAPPSPLAIANANVAAGLRIATASSVVDKRAALDARPAAVLPAPIDTDAAALVAIEAGASIAPLDVPSAHRQANQSLAVLADEAADRRTGDNVPSRPTLELATAPAVVAAATAAQRAIPEAAAVEIDAPVPATKGAEPLASLSPTANTTTPAPVVVAIETPVHDASWRVDAASRIATLVTRGIEHAEVRVTPPELGPVELRIDVRGGEATLAIVATQSATRDALEQALPLLRDMLAQQGLSLGQATVADGRAEAQQGNNGSSSSRADSSAGSVALDDADAARAARPRIARGLIDVFA